MGQAAAGYLMAKEVDAFRQILVDPPKPFCAIVGGAKVSDKILLLENERAAKADADDDKS